ncbi:MAG: TRAP transporter substrate-binding protein [Sphaerochaetaceae bacterium]|nr:TRAP transporter substrate-binding protein [Spirochaetales bacterium]MDY5500523.1 TRAP transporter substrate-binding protein [Sphaerochaetaceae bacterium]
MKKLLLVVSALALAGGCLFANGNSEVASSTLNSKPVVLKFALQNGENHPLCQGVAKFADLVKEKSDGRISFQLFYSGALGSKTATVQGMQTGTIDGGMLMGGVIADYGPDKLKVFTLPYLFDSVDQARAFEKSADGRALLDTVQSSGSKMVCIGVYQESARNYFFTKKDVKSPADMKNLMVRCQEGSVYYDAAEALGANVQSVAFSELYSALQSGVVDGAEQPLSGFVNNAFQEVAKYYVLDQHEISPNLILMSEITWNKLSGEDQALIKECFDESVPYFEQISDAKDTTDLQQMKDAGVKVNKVDVSEWQKACESVYAKYDSQYGDLIRQIKASK